MNAIASSTSLTGTIGRTGPNISLKSTARTSALPHAHKSSKPHALAHQRVVAAHIAHERRRDVLLGDVGLAAKHDRAPRLVDEPLDALRVLLRDDAPERARGHWVRGMEFVVSARGKGVP